MAITMGTAQLALSIVTGAIKLGGKLDDLMASKILESGSMSLSFPPVTGDPTQEQLAVALESFLADPDGRALPEAERQRLQGVIDSGSRLRGSKAVEKYGLQEVVQVAIWLPDQDFQKLLRERRRRWDLREEDVRRVTYFVAAGPALRSKSLTFQIAATVLDVVAEVLGQNTQLITNDKATQELIAAVLQRFSEPDLETMGGWSQLMEHALSATLNAVVDKRELLAGKGPWVEHTLSALARAKQNAGDDFVVGLLRGDGYPQLVRGLLEEGSEIFSDGDESAWEDMLAGMLSAAAGKITPASNFETYFQDNWHVLVGAGLHSLEDHGPRLIEDQLMSQVFVATVSALAESFDQGPPGPEVIDAAVGAAVSVFADPKILEGRVPDEWMAELIASTAGALSDTVSEGGLRSTFSRTALERYARGSFEVLSRYPEVIGGDSQIVQTLLTNVLGRMADPEVETFAVQALADIAVESALDALAQNAQLFDTRYAELIGDVAGLLAQRVAHGGLSSMQAEDLVDVFAGSVADNEQLFVRTRDALARTVVEAILDGAAESTQDGVALLAGQALVATVQRALEQTAITGGALDGTMDVLAGRLRQAVVAALALAADRLGQGLAQTDLPDVVVLVAAGLADLPDEPAELEAFLAHLVDQIAATHGIGSLS